MNLSTSIEHLYSGIRGDKGDSGMPGEAGKDGRDGNDGLPGLEGSYYQYPQFPTVSLFNIGVGDSSVVEPAPRDMQVLRGCGFESY